MDLLKNHKNIVLPTKIEALKSYRLTNKLLPPPTKKKAKRNAHSSKQSWNQSWNYKRVQHRPNQQQNCNQTAKQAATKVQNKPPKAATLHDKQPKNFKKPHQTG